MAAQGGAKPEAAAAPAPADLGDFKELTAEELKKLTKEDRTAYHLKRRQIMQAGGAKPAAAQLSKAERREVQQANEKKKKDAKEAAAEDFTELEELMLQGLSEEDAKHVLATEAAARKEVADDADEDDDEPEDLASVVRDYLKSNAEAPELLSATPDDALHDFNMKVRFQGHVNSCPPDHLTCCLETLFGGALSGCDLTSKLKPTTAKESAMEPLKRWAPLLKALYSKIDVLEAADIVVGVAHSAATAQKGATDATISCAAVGCLMAVQDIEIMDDDDLQSACKRLEAPTKTMQGFIEFLEDDDSDSD